METKRCFLGTQQLCWGQGGLGSQESQAHDDSRGPVLEASAHTVPSLLWPLGLHLTLVSCCGHVVRQYPCLGQDDSSLCPL